jgi:hypothetical protein
MKLPKRVSSGRYVDLNALTVEDIDIADINSSLNYLYRFTGHHKDVEPLTVAQHTNLTMMIAEKLYPDDFVLRFDCLLHDTPECYYGDIATPLKNKFGSTYRDYVATIDSIVYQKLWILNEKSSLVDQELYKKRKICDGISLDIERKIMWKDQRGKEYWPMVDSPFSMKENKAMYDTVQKTRVFNITDNYNSMINEYWNM